MANPDVRRHLTDRDEEILLALQHSPLTVAQLLKLSQTFPGLPFLSTRNVQDRLQKLKEAGWVRSFPYAFASRGSPPDYYKTTPLGFRLAFGENTPPPTKRHFDEVSVAGHHHTHSLAEFIVHVVTSAHRRGIRMKQFCSENAHRIRVGGEVLVPDCVFELHAPGGRQFNFLVELDCGTERIRSDKDTDSWTRKVRLYHKARQECHPNRFRVLVVTTRPGGRLRSILSLAGAEAAGSRRSLFYGVDLDAFLSEPDAVVRPCFRDHRDEPVALVPEAASGPPPRNLVSPLVASDTIPGLPDADVPMHRGSPLCVLPSPSS